MSPREWINAMNERLYGPESVFTTAEQTAMRVGFTRVERLAVSGRVFGAYPQAINDEHAQKLRVLNRELLPHVNIG